MRKLLLLGGSAQQIIAIQAAKDMGYYTVLCDYLNDNPGQYIADKFYLVSTTDKEAVLEVAKKEKIDGIVAYSSDPAAPTAAYVSEKLGLPGVPYDIAECFCEKHLFRIFLRKNGFNVPASVEISNGIPTSDINVLEYPIIVKPTDSSGSKGVSVVRQPSALAEAVEFAGKYSRNGTLIAEEFIERDHKDVIEAEIFVTDGKVTVWGLINCVRDQNSNPLLPAAYSYPLNVSPERKALVKNEISRLVECSRVKNGAFNIELVITNKNKLYFLDVGPRNGGNMLPEFIGYIMDKNLAEATVCAAMGDIDHLKGLVLDGESGGYWGLSVLHTAADGIFEDVAYSPAAKDCLIRECRFIKSGENVHAFKMARDAIGLAFFHFRTQEERDSILNDFEGEHIRILMK